MEAGAGQGGWIVVKGRAVTGDDVPEGHQGQIVAGSYTVLRNVGLDLVF